MLAKLPLNLCSCCTDFAELMRGVKQQSFSLINIWKQGVQTQVLVEGPEEECVLFSPHLLVWIILGVFCLVGRCIAPDRSLGVITWNSLCVSSLTCTILLYGRITHCNIGSCTCHDDKQFLIDQILKHRSWAWICSIIWVHKYSH